FFFFSSRRRHTRCLSDWSSDVCSSDLVSVGRRCSVLDRSAATDEKRRKSAGGMSVRIGIRRSRFTAANSARCDAQLRSGTARLRSEERRVGKEWRAGGGEKEEKKRMGR